MFGKRAFAAVFVADIQKIVSTRGKTGAYFVQKAIKRCDCMLVSSCVML